MSHNGPETERFPPHRERALNVPWPVLALVGSWCAIAALQNVSGAPDAWLVRYGLIPAELSAGRWPGLVTSNFLHQGLLHLGVNSVMALAFGAPVARLLGGRPAGATLFFLFFLVCGIAGGLTFWLLHPQYPGPLIGASGGVSGLMGAAARLIDRPGSVGPLLSRTVLSFAAALVLVNLLVAAAGFAPGAVGVAIAWEAHLGGLLLGLLLIGPLARLARGGI